MAEQEQQEQQELVTFKGFDSNLRCRGFQFEVGATYEHEGPVAACESGFHSCEYPLDVFIYYAPADSRYAVVKASGQLSRHNSDTKIASGRITIEAEITIPQLVTKAIEWVVARCAPADTKNSEGDQSASSATGDQSASSATGYQSASSATGNQSASSATGDQSASSATGDQSASSASGIAAVALNIGRMGRARASDGGAIVLCNHDDDGNLRHIRAAKVGEHGIRPDTFYTLNDDGEFVECAEE